MKINILLDNTPNWFLAEIDACSFSHVLYASLLCVYNQELEDFNCRKDLVHANREKHSLEITVNQKNSVCARVLHRIAHHISQNRRHILWNLLTRYALSLRRDEFSSSRMGHGHVDCCHE